MLASVLSLFWSGTFLRARLFPTRASQEDDSRGFNAGAAGLDMALLLVTTIHFVLPS
jgi:hypothetical protein